MYVLFTATKNADQTLALWRMAQKFAFFPDADESGVAPQASSIETKMFIYMSAVFSATVMWLRYGHTA